MKERTEKYLADVRKGLSGMDKKAKEGILAELRSHIEDSLAACETQLDRNYFFDGLEEPKKLARSYREIYGYGAGFNIAFIMASIVIAILSVPLIYQDEPETLASGIYALAVVVAGACGYLCGKKIGIIAGTGAAAGRILMFLIIYITTDRYILRTDDMLAFIFVSLVLAIAGWGMGQAKENWPGSESV